MRPWEPSNPDRWAFFGLADPHPSGTVPVSATTGDLLVYALTLPESQGPVEGIVDAVRVKLTAVADLLGEHIVSGLLKMQVRRLIVHRPHPDDARTTEPVKLPPWRGFSRSR